MMALILYRSPFSVVYMVNTGGGSPDRSVTLNLPPQSQKTKFQNCIAHTIHLT